MALTNMKRSKLLLAAVLLPFLVPATNASAQLSVTVFTDKQNYGPGELITVSGQVLDEDLQGVAFTTVSIQVNDPNGNPIHITSVISSMDGSFTDQFTVPAGSTNGGYTVFATASKSGYTDATNQTAYAVIPEFPVSNILWVVLASLLTAVLLTRRKIKRS
jgi:uncharacterized protein YfaS (alpha-2-macroglobulin family)